MKSQNEKPSSETKKKSIFKKFSFKKKKSDNQQEQEEGGDIDSAQRTNNSSHSEKVALNISEKDLVLTPNQDNDGDTGHDDVSILQSLNEPSCFMPNVIVSEFPDTQIYRLALKANKENLRALIASVGEDHPNVNVRKLQTAEVYKGLGMLPEAVQLLSEVIASYTRLGNDPLLMSSAMNDLALVYATLHQHKNAEDLFHQTAKILSQTVEADQAVVWGNIAITLRNSNKHSKAIPMHELAVKMMATILGGKSPEALFQQGQLAVTLKQSGHAGDKQRGEELLEESIDQLKTLGYGQSHVWIQDLLVVR